MSVSAEVTMPTARVSEPVSVDSAWLDVAVWYKITPPEPLDAPALSPFSYDLEYGEYAINLVHPQALRLARLVLEGAVDHDKVLYSELDGQVYDGVIDADEQAEQALQRRVAGRLIGFVDDSDLQKASLIGVAAANPRTLFDSLDAYTRLPQLSITDRELAHDVRQKFIDFQHEFALQGVID